MVGVSLVTARPLQVSRTMVRLHTPEHLVLDRGSYHPEGGQSGEGDRSSPRTDRSSWSDPAHTD
jgi:hypothetical protein